MISPTVLAQLSVQDFFRDYNWQGQTPKLESLNPSESLIDASDWLKISLGKFLSQNNWKGLVQPELTQPDKVLSLTLTVQEYFQFRVWDAQPIVAVVSRVPKRKTETAEKFQVTDLSNLF